MARNYSSVAPEKTLSQDVSSASTTITLNNLTGLPSYPYALVINPDTVLEEIVIATGLFSGTTINVTRAAEASSTAPGSTAKAHSQGNKVRHMITARDLQDSSDHINASTLVHGLGSGEGAVVGTTKTQTLTLKTLTSPVINTPTINTPTFNAGVSGTIPISSTELGYIDGLSGKVTDLLDLKANIASPTFTGTVNLPTNTIFPALGNGLVPTGSIVMWAHTVSTTIPTGWLLCDGRSTTGYTALAAIVGATVPDLTTRVPVGYKSGDDAFGTYKGTGGSKTSTAAHTHSLSAHVHSDDHRHSGATGLGDSDHAHTFSFTETLDATGDGAGRYDSSSATSQGTQTYATGGTTGGTRGDGTHAHSFTTNYKSEQGHGDKTGAPINSVGGTSLDISGASSAAVTNGNLQPYFSLNFIIKT
jgi:microcystin-dependent protein